MTVPEEVVAYVITAPGIERITARELASLGIEPVDVERGGILFRGSADSVQRANLWLRTATRILVRVATFHASSFAELERRGKKVPWEKWLPPRGEVKFRVTCRKSRLYHSDAVAERLMNAAAKSRSDLTFGVAAKDDADGDPQKTEPAQLFVVRVAHDAVTISADSSGELLHRRGYRPEATRASLRETLAAAMLLASEWAPDTPLLDPLCGSGTIPIEAAMIARKIAPGSGRSFSFERWPSFDKDGWLSLLAHGNGLQLPSAPAPIFGGDRDAGAIDISTRNAERAGVGESIEFHRRSLAESLDVLAGREKGKIWVLTNPPYGIRVGGGGELRNLYGMLGARAENQGWSLGVLTSDEKLARQSARLSPGFRTQNGGIPVTFFTSGREGEK